MIEIFAVIALILALLALAGSSAPVAAFFIAVAVFLVVVRLFKANQQAKRTEGDVKILRGELQRMTTLAERAVRIAAEAANDVSALKQRGVAVESSKPAEPVAPAPAATVVETKPPVPTPAPGTPEPVLPRVEEIPVWSASTKTPVPIAPKIQELEKPAVPPVAPQAPPPTVKPPAPITRTAPPVAQPVAPMPPRPAFAAAPVPPKPPRKTIDMEEMLGKNWLSKIGMILLVIGIAGWGVTYFWHYGPAAKVGLLTTIALVVLVGGIFLERKENYKTLGRTGIGGGWATLFFVSYALNHVAMMRLVGSEVADAVVMLIVAGAMVVHTLRYRSQLVTGFAFLLAYSTISLCQDTVYSLVAGAILAAAIVTIVVRRNWFELEIFAILASYGSHFYWLYRLLGPNGAGGHPFPEFLPSATLLVFYWASFRTSYVIRRIQNAAQEQLSTGAAILNTVLLLVVMRFQSAHPQLAFYALLVLGALEFSIGQLPITKKRRQAFVILTIIGVMLMLTAVPLRYSGNNVSILWLMGGEVLLFAGIFTAEQLFRRLGLLTGLVAVGWVVLRDLPRMIETRQGGFETTMVADGILLFAMAVVFYANNAMLRMRWPLLFTDRFDSGLLTVTSYPGAITLALACWATFASDRMAVAYASAMLAVILLGWMIKSRHLQLQSLGLAVLAAERALAVNSHWRETHVHLTSRIVSLIVVSAMYYVAAKFALHRDNEEQRIIRGVFAVFGTFFAETLLLAEIPSAWQALALAFFAWALLEAARLTKYGALRWHTHVAAFCSFGLAVMSEVGSTPQWHGIHVGIWKVLPVIAVFYLLAYRASRIHAEITEIVRMAYTWTATGLALWLIYLSFDQKYVAAAWVLYALGLTAVSRWTKWNTLVWQAFAIGILSAGFAGFTNLLGTTPNVHDAVRLAVTLIVALSLYVMSEALRLPPKTQPVLVIHAWLASGLAAGLMWYELSPAAIAVGWALLGLALFEYGTWRKNVQWRWQAYLALAGSFVRIFFANLATGEGGEWLSTRMVTVLPMVAIYFYVYLREAEFGKASSRRFDPSILFAYFGTAAVMALAWFQFANEWVVVAWAALVIILLGVAVLARQSLFAQQAVLVAVGVLSRGMFHNLFGGSYFSGSDWRGRFGVLGAAIALLFASLPLAFEQRRRSSVGVELRGFRRTIALVEHRVEQPIFFVAVALLTTMLALKMDHARVTLSWGAEAVMIFVGALIANERSFRLTGLGLLLVCVLKIALVDLWKFPVVDRYLTLIGVGALLVAVSFLYSRYSTRIRQYL